MSSVWACTPSFKHTATPPPCLPWRSLLIQWVYPAILPKVGSTSLFNQVSVATAMFTRCLRTKLWVRSPMLVRRPRTLADRTVNW
ncbi:hypothetical protein E2C01_091423 [Portunus trituberculatus]|uniref:Uncharacterized protein n=1 Tax=Portunus trituberculatus TaxID=210409 RepID=A0A5B7JDX5_PORTR|nr:hypothetical protein [Portunus trituberculatus]